MNRIKSNKMQRFYLIFLIVLIAIQMKESNSKMIWKCMSQNCKSQKEKCMQQKLCEEKYHRFLYCHMEERSCRDVKISSDFKICFDKCNEGGNSVLDSYVSCLKDCSATSTKLYLIVYLLAFLLIIIM